MLYEVIFQPKVFAILFLGGFFCGFLYDLKSFLHFFKKNKIFKHFFDFLLIFLTFFCYFFINLKINFGQIRFFSILAFILGPIFQRYIIKKFVAKIIMKCYNKFKGRRNERKKT